MTVAVDTASTRVDTPGPRSAAPKVLAIIVTHDGRQWLKKCLASINVQSYPNLDILVVDDASPKRPGEPELRRVAKRHLGRRRWAFLRTPRPLGFGGAINWALGRVRTEASLLLFVHDDAALDRRSVERMVARIYADESTAVVGPKIVSWDNPDILEEVGMATDKFGYPYKGLEKGEIDLRQHDAPVEVFYVTSTCMLVRREVFRELHGWDSNMRAFAEDLDLCWRARVAGYTVRVEPRAKARHVMALATGQRESRFTPTRYFMRRNRLRAVTKNVSNLRLLVLIPQFVLLTLAEMIGFIVLRQPGEILNLARALAWNVARAPQTLALRTRVQRRRKVTDRRLLRLTVRESTRMRAYVGSQADRLEEVWGRRADFVSRQTTEARAMRSRVRSWQVLAVAALGAAILIGLRHFLWGPQVSVGELLPYPDRFAAMWRAFLSPWQPAGLGAPGPAPPAFVILGAFPLVTLGAVGAAQKLLVLFLGALAFVGAAKLVSDLVDRPARYGAGLVYALGAVGYAGLRQGALGALVFGAMAPFALLYELRLIGWTRPPAWDRGRAVARLAIAAAITGAFVPGALYLYAALAVLLTGARALLDHGTQLLRGLVASVIAIILGWALLLPWSAEWFTAGGPLHQLTNAGSWRLYAGSFRGTSMLDVVLGQTPVSPAFFGLALPLLGLIAVLIAEGQRRRVALALWTVVVSVGWYITAVAKGDIRPVVASPTEAGVLVAAAFAGLVGIALGAFRMDLPRRRLGIVHAIVIGGLAFSIFLVGAGLLPAMWHGEWEPGRGTHQIDVTTVDTVRALLAGEEEQTGQFRALWIGPGWLPDRPSAARAETPYLLTGPRGEVLSDLFHVGGGAAQTEFDRDIASVEHGRTDLGGSLLGAFNVHFIVLQRTAGASRWLTQRDLAVTRSEPGFLLLENQSFVARAALYPKLPPFVTISHSGSLSQAAAQAPAAQVTADQNSPARYSAPDARGPGVVFAAEARDPHWSARVGGTSLQRTDGGWGNAFRVPASASGTLVVSFARSLWQVVWPVVMLLAWIVAAGAAFSRRRRPGTAPVRARA
jgi:GT2 family glycosyltransferase